MTNLKTLFTQATARPWTIKTDSRGDIHIDHESEPDDKGWRTLQPIIDDVWGNNPANARLITLAANHFEAVVEALETALESICFYHCQPKGLEGKHVKVCNDARSVLATIEKELP